jgi:hypothetical protein
MKSEDLLAAGWEDITGSFAERDRFLELASRGEAVVRRLRDGWFAKESVSRESTADKSSGVFVDILSAREHDVEAPTGADGQSTESGQLTTKKTKGNDTK